MSVVAKLEDSKNTFNLLAGNPRIGILFSCLTVHGWSEKCQLNRRLPLAWTVALMVMLSGCLATVATIAIMIYSHWKRRAIVFAKWTGLAVGEFHVIVVLIDGIFSPQ